ncbi:hypothetical protein [Micromonospora sp. NPDC005367]|uniref:hypothetical protein n=1 Tax=Micromonospora sp. NPDC005367 TaxID=3155590 RepID=UPI0033A40820
MIPAPRDATAGPAEPVGAARDPITERALAARASDPAAQAAFVRRTQVQMRRFATNLVRRLPVARRAAIALTRPLGPAYAEAAVVVWVPLGTVRPRVARSRDDLVEAVGDAPAG